MRDKLIEILTKEIELSLTDDYKGIYIDGIYKAADAIIISIIDKYGDIIYPSMEEVSEWSFMVPEEATKWQCYATGVKDCMNYIKANNDQGCII